MASSHDVVVVVFPYEASDSNQLSLTTGEEIRVIEASDRGWSIGAKLDGTMGLFPAAYCKGIEKSSQQEFAVTLEEKTAQLHATAGQSYVSSPRHSTSLDGSSSPTYASMQRRTAERHNRQSEMLSQLGITGDDDGFGPRASTSFGGTDRVDRLMESVTTLRRVQAAVEEDISSIGQHGRELDVQNFDRAAELRVLTEKRQKLVEDVRVKDAELEELNKVNEILRAQYMGEPLPEFTPSTASAMVETTAAPSEPPVVAEEPATPSASPPINSPDDIEESKPRKYATKLLARIAESQETKAGYEKRVHKLQKKIAKTKAVTDEERTRRAAEAETKMAAAAAAQAEAASELESARQALDEVMKQLETIEAEAVAAEKSKQKVAKKVKKGDAAMVELDAQLEEARSLKAGGAEKLAEVKAANAALEEQVANAEVEAAVAAKAYEAGVAAERQKGNDLEGRIVKEKQRIASYREAIEKFKAAAAEAAAAEAAAAAAAKASKQRAA